MRKGEFPDGSKTLRAKIDMAHPNLNMRDPIMYRILHETHHRQGDKWCIYPMYDWAHGFEDSIEGITHSICTLEFENHRPLYDWFIDAVNEGRTDDGSGPWGKKIHHPAADRVRPAEPDLHRDEQAQAAQAGQGGPRPRLGRPAHAHDLRACAGAATRPSAIRQFAKVIGVNKFNSTVDIALLEHCLREDLNKTAPRVMAVLHPLKVVIDNYPDGQVEEMDAVNNPEDPAAGTRKVPFSQGPVHRAGRLHGEAAQEVLPALARQARSGCATPTSSPARRWSRTPRGKVVELHCTYDPATRGGDAPDGRKVKATLHWVSAAHALEAEVRLYDRLFTKEDPEDVPEGQDFTANLNPNSLEVLTDCKVEPSLKADKAPGPVPVRAARLLLRRSRQHRPASWSSTAP